MPEQSLADDPRLDSILRGVEIFKAREAAKTSLIDHPDLASVLRGVEICLQREKQHEDLVGKRAREHGVAPGNLYQQFIRERDKTRRPQGFKRALAGAGLATLAAFVSLSGGSPVKSHDQPLETVPGYSVSDTVNPPEPVLDKPTNLTESLMKPFLKEALKKRQERAKTDPEYNHRVDRELNENRINMLLFGYGEEHGQTYEDYGGHMSILSYDLKSGKISAIHLSRDTLVPELKEYPVSTGSVSKAPVLRNVYKAGGFDLMRKTAERATQLAVDFQLVVKDTVIRDAISKLADGNLELNVHQEHDVQSFRLGGVDYEGGLISAGRQTMDTMQVMRYMMAESKNPQKPEDERTLRKNEVLETLLKKVVNKAKANPLFLKDVIEFLDGQIRQKNIMSDFNLNSLTGNFIQGLINMAVSRLTNLGKDMEISLPEIDSIQQININDPMFGGSAVSRTHVIEHNYQKPERHDNPRVVQEIINGLFPPWMLIVDGGDPHSENLVEDYWKSVRELVKGRLSE